MNRVHISVSQRWSHLAVLISFYGLIAFFGVLSLNALDSVRFASLIIFLLQTAPLWPFAWGLHGQHRRSHLWLSLVVLLYFMHGVLVAFDSDRRWQGLVEVLLSVGLFGSLVAYIRIARKQTNP